MLITLQQLKDYLNITDTTSDAILTSAIKQAGDFIESYTGRRLELQDYTLRIDGNWQDELILPHYPVNALTSLSYNTGTLGTPVWTTFDADNYMVDSETGIVSLTFSLNRWIKNIQAIFSAWYDLSESCNSKNNDLQRATMQIATYYYSGVGKTTSQVKKEQVDGASIEYDTTIGGIEQDTYVILNKYKKYV